jgi:RNA-directed DNA polymerase
MTTAQAVGAVSRETAEWYAINWQAINRNVRRLQVRIVQATKASRWGRVRALQRLLTHSYSGKVLAVRRVTENNGKKTPGVDQEIWDTPEKKTQAVHLLALGPVVETTADKNSYGFRQQRSCADAIEQCFKALRSANTQWILEGDIKSCFDKISHDWLLAHVLMDRVILRKWLKSGYMEKHVLHETTDGTPQGGIISPVLANCALDGLERLLQGKYPAGKRLKSLGGEKPCVNLVRYADDFVITSKSKELPEGEIKPLVEHFLQERGLELSPTKTVITHVEHGFDFLGQNVRRYPNGKLLIKPSKKNVKTFLDGIRRTIKAAHGVSAADLIDQLNPKIRGWANYHRHVVSKHTFGHVDCNIFSSLWQWARRRHPNKSPRWFKPKYFDRRGNRDWSFFGETCDDEGRPNKVWLYYAKSTPIKRHVKVKGEANPYDPTYETYFEEREGAHMLETFRGVRTLRYLWYEQRGLCTQCNTKITRITGWRLHYCLPRVMGGSTGAPNCVLLHPECHDRVHRQRVPVSKPRLL